MSKKVYPDKAAALKACSDNASMCTGISKIGGKWYIMKGTSITGKKGSKTFLMGEWVTITTYMVFASESPTIPGNL